MRDEHTYGQKRSEKVRKGRTKVIYKGTFISKQSLYLKLKGKHMSDEYLIEDEITFDSTFLLLMLTRIETPNYTSHFVDMMPIRKAKLHFAPRICDKNHHWEQLFSI